MARKGAELVRKRTRLDRRQAGSACPIGVVQGFNLGTGSRAGAAQQNVLGLRGDAFK